MTDTRRRRVVTFSGTWRRRAAAALTVLLLPIGTANAAPAPRPAKAAVLTEGTSLTWRGVAGIRFTVPRSGKLPPYGARLTLRGGTYALVRMVPDKAGCSPCPTTGWLDYHRDLADFFAPRSTERGSDHLARIGYGDVYKGTLDLYLFTDGEATVSFEQTDLPRAVRHYRPTGRVNGRFVPLPLRCPPTVCTRLRYGGAAGGDVGARGSVDSLVASWDRAAPPTYQYPQPRPRQTCHYDRNGSPGVSTDPADHPYGCDPDPYGAAIFAGGLLPLFYGAYSTEGSGNAAGPVYIGFQEGTAHDLADPTTLAYGVAFEYGIR